MSSIVAAQQPDRSGRSETDERAFAAFLAMVEADSLGSVAQAPAESQAPANQQGLDQQAPANQQGPQANQDPRQGQSQAGEPLPRPIAETAPAQRAIAGQSPVGDESAGDESSEDDLTLADVVASLYRAYPEIELSRQFLPQAGGELLSAYGAYDTKFHAHSLSEPTGFYENYRNGLGVARQTWWGGYLAAGYRIGRGFYQPWYKERQTDDAGEFKIGVAQPLLQGRAIDPQRVAVFQASLQQQATTPMVQETILAISREAIAVYWEWVSAGAVLEAQSELLDLAVVRGKKFQAGVNAGKFARIDLILNQQLIAERKANRLKAEQKFRETAFKLGLYLRDPAGNPLVPSDVWLPAEFPKIQPQNGFDFNAELASAISRRPEPQILQYQYRQVALDRRLARNDLLPRFDFVSEMSQDMGEPSTKSDDKGEFELVIGFQSEVPIQRRKARGKIQSTNAKMIQINEKIRLVRDKIATDLRIAHNKLTLAQQIVDQSEISLRAAIDTLRRYEKGFEKGYIDLIYLNLLETKANETEIKLVEAQRDWFTALGELQIALGLDPLDQAMNVSSLPPSNMPGPGNLPDLEAPDDQTFEQDWKLHGGQQQGENAGGNPGE